MSNNGNGRGNLKPPWAPGQSGNPSGRKKTTDIPILRLLPELLAGKELVGITVPRGQTVERFVAEQWIRHACAGKGQYMQMLIDRLAGPLATVLQLSESDVRTALAEVSLGKVMASIATRETEEPPPEPETGGTS